LAGGNIKNIIVNAAFLAAEDSGSITMEHMIKAAKKRVSEDWEGLFTVGVWEILWGDL
jgi:hypothetical protein